MQSTKTLIFDVQNTLFEALNNIFEGEIKIYKILKECPKNYILIESVKEESVSTNVKKFSFSILISTDFFEEEKLKFILNKFHFVEESLKEKFINIKIISTEVKSPTSFKGFEAKTTLIIFV